MTAPPPAPEEPEPTGAPEPEPHPTDAELHQELDAEAERSGSGMGRRLVAGVLFGVLVYAGIVLWLDAGAILDALRDFAWWTFPAACALAFGNYALRFIKWERYRKLLGIELERRTSFVIYLAGFSMGVTPGKMGEVFKSWLIKRVNGTPIHVSAPIVVAERLTDLFGFLILVAIGGLVSAPEYAPVFAATFVLCVVAVFLCGSPRAAAKATSIVRRLPMGDRLAPRLEGAFESARVLLAPREVIGPTLLSAVSWGLECLAFLLIARSLAPAGIELSLAFALFAYSISAIAGAVAIIFPGGIGPTEGLLGSLTRGAYEPGLVHLGSEAALATARTKAAGAVLLTRFATLWFGVLVGLGATWVFRRMKRPPAPPATPAPADAPRQLSTEEARILGLIQEHYGPQNTPEQVTWIEGEGATLWVKDRAGGSVLMAHLTNLADWRLSGDMTEQQLRTTFLQLDED